MSDQAPEVTVEELKQAMDEGRKPFLLDVREAHELRLSKLDYDAHIPMDLVESRLDELDRDAEIVVICRTGNRSGAITELLRANGFAKAKNLVGGMNAWAKKIDRSMRQY